GSDGRVWAVGGDSALQAPLATVEVFNTTTNTWVAAAPLSQSRTLLGAALGADGRVYAVGGANPQTNTYYGNNEAYGPSISVSPTSGFLGQSVTMSGSNFGANATVRVYLGTVATGTLLATTTSNGSGGLPGGQVSFSVPLTATAGTT